jgi:hypothetical protein
MRSRGAILASPLLCLGVLAAVAADNAGHLPPREATAYHNRIRGAVEAYPYVIGSWVGKDCAVPQAAVKLLRPNIILSRQYISEDPATGSVIEAELLIVHCTDSRDMTGHFPPICYPANGQPLLEQRGFSLMCGDVPVKGTEFIFDCHEERSGWSRKSVYDFFVVPRRGVVPHITDVRAAGADYQQRSFGAAQFQVVMNADLPPEQRDVIFTTLVGADSELIKLLNPS